MSQIFQHHTMFHDHVDNVYYNAELYNPINSTELLPAEYSETRNQPIIQGVGSDYYVSVIRFNIPSTVIPIFSFQPVSAGSATGIYTVTLRHGGVDYQTNVIFTPRGAGIDYQVYAFQHFLDMINTALATSFASIAPPPATATEAPYLTYDAVTSLISLHVQKAYITDNIQLFMNWSLFSFFQSWPIIFNGYNNQPNGKDAEIIIADYNNNTDPADPTYFIFQQEEVSLNLWYDIRKIVITTNSLQVQREYIASQDENGNPIFLPILTDFTPTFDKNNALTQFQYFPSGPYRLTDINSNEPIRKIDFQVFWEDKFRNLHKIALEPSQTLNIKLLFMRKTELNLYNAL